MVDFGRFISDLGISSLRQVVGIARGLMLIPLITKLAGADTYGYWAAITALVGLVATMGGLHMHGALIRYIDEDNGNTLSDTLSVAFTVAAVVLVGFTLVDVFVPNPPLVSEIDSKDEYLFTAIGALAGLTIVFQLLQNVPRAWGNIKVFEITNVAQKILEIAVLAIVFVVTQDVVLAVWGLVATTLVMNVGLGFYALRGRISRPQFSNIRKYLAYGGPMLPKELSGSLLTHADKFLILYFLSPTAVGIYAVCYGIAKLINNVSSILNPTLYPTVTRAWRNEEYDHLELLYHNLFRGYFFFGLPAAAGMALVAEPLVSIISTEEIAAEATILIPVLAVGFLLYGYEFSLSYILTAAEETGRIGGINVTAAVVNVGLNLLFIPAFGLVGAAIATVLSQGLLFGYLYYRARVHVPFPFPTVDVGRSIVATAVMIVVLLSLPPLGSGRMTLVVFPIVGVVVYAVALLASGAVSRSEIETVIISIR